MAEPPSSSSPARTIDKPSYDVFLSFRGEDTRKGFTSHLYNALCQRGISTFIDNEELERGERIEELFNYIDASKIFVPVLSKGYADSRWCLREITKMVECGRQIIPIFFHVDPKDVRKQSGPFQLDKSSDGVGEEDLRKWKDALRAVGEISGYSFQNDTNEDEGQLIRKVVEEISRKLNKKARPITEHLIGMDSHIDKMYKLLDLTDKEVKMIGIVGMGGLGKTTIATVVYNKLLSDFKDYSFIKNVREGFKQYNGGVDLQKRLIKDILKVEHPDVADVEEGASMIRDRFKSKKVVVILDDADHIEQLQALAGERDWFGSGSRIIITSRYSGVLLDHRVKNVDIYRPEHLNKENSLKLFESHAFPDVRPTESEYRELSMKFVKVTGGLPLALKIFGSLVRRKTIEQWKENLEKLNQIPNKDIVKSLRISYDGLDENVKQIFLDISCFLIREKKEYATYMWEDSRLYPETAITELQERSLINFNKHDEFEMHDLLRDMGRSIVAQQGEQHWQWSRLWNLDDLRKSLEYKDKPRKAEGITAEGIVSKRPGYGPPANDSYLSTRYFVDVSKRPGYGPPANDSYLSTRDFVDFSCLRLLHLDKFAFKGEFLCLPETLKWLRLVRCTFSISILQHIPKWLCGVCNLNAISIVELSILELIFMDDVDLFLMKITSSSRKAFDALKVLRLQSSRMVRTPDFSKMKMMSLRKLTLRNCKKITEVDGSIGSLKTLVHLELSYCIKLQRLPDSICTLMSLETLILNGCNSLSSLPEKLGDMKSLRELQADRTRICAIPDSIGDLSNLRTLSLIGNDHLKKLPDSMKMLDSLEGLYLDHFAERLGDRFNHFYHVPFNLMNLDSAVWIEKTERFKWLVGLLPNSAFEKVKELTIDDDAIQELPPYLGRLTNLEALSIHCKNLGALPEWPGQLLKLKSFNLYCNSLEALPEWLGQLQKLKSFKLYCDSLQALPECLGQLQKLKSFELNCHSLDSIGEGLSLASSVVELYIKCGSIEALPLTAGSKFENLRSLELHCRALKHVPDWIASLERLEKLSLSGCKSITFRPTSMAHLTGKHCHLDLSPSQTVPDSPLFCLTSLTLASGCLLRTLDLSYSNICCLLSPMSNLAQLEELHLRGCDNLQSLPPLPSSLLVLNATECNNLRTISDVSNLKSLKELKLGGCSLLGDFCGLESIAHNLETLELPGPCGGLSSFSQLSPAFMPRLFKGAAFSSLKKFGVRATRQYGEPTDHHQSFWITFPKEGRGGKRPTCVEYDFSAPTSRIRKRCVSTSIMEEEGRVIYQCTIWNLGRNIHYLSYSISGKEIGEYSGEGSYLRMEVAAPTSILMDIRRHLHYASMEVVYT